jgi:hypothetical protein
VSDKSSRRGIKRRRWYGSGLARQLNGRSREKNKRVVYERTGMVIETHPRMVNETSR